MTNTETTPRTRSGKDRVDDESVRDDQRVAWHTSANGVSWVGDELPIPVHCVEVYELVSVMLKSAPLDRFDLTDEDIDEIVSHRAWPGFLHWVTEIRDFIHMHDRDGRW